MAKASKLLVRRKERVRSHIRKVTTRIRLTVYKSNNNIFAQVIDDSKGVTLASASTLDAEVKAKIKNGGNKEAAKVVGGLIAVRAKKVKVEQVVFDRSGYIYHGRIKELAEAARAGGLDF